jgi:hypothetical protein
VGRALAAIACIALLRVVPVAAEGPVATPSALATPAILSVTVVPNHVRPGHAFVITVDTTPDVTSVEGSVLKYRFAIPKTAPGVFSATAHVPWWARIFHGTFHVQFTATNPTGAQAQAEAAVSI